ncbi:MAG TPA: hypothetical protein DHU63_06650 [Candidatus Marinimicrobia bacterium]|nr:hypothetical protein [Candidatus Neomarinimicrobiota bacterium]
MAEATHIQLKLFISVNLFIPVFVTVSVIAPPNKRRKMTIRMQKARASGLFVTVIMIDSLFYLMKI